MEIVPAGCYEAFFVASCGRQQTAVRAVHQIQVQVPRSDSYSLRGPPPSARGRIEHGCWAVKKVSKLSMNVIVRNNDLVTKFGGLVLGCIEAGFCNQSLI